MLVYRLGFKTLITIAVTRIKVEKKNKKQTKKLTNFVS